MRSRALSVRGFDESTCRLLGDREVHEDGQTDGRQLNGHCAKDHSADGGAVFVHEVGRSLGATFAEPTSRRTGKKNAALQDQSSVFTTETINTLKLQPSILTWVILWKYINHRTNYIRRSDAELLELD